MKPPGKKAPPEKDAKAYTGRLPKLLTPAQLAEALGWTYSKVQRLVYGRKIPVVRIAGRVHFSEPEIVAWIATQTRDGTTPAPPQAPTGRNRREDRIWLGLDPDEENPFRMTTARTRRQVDQAAALGRQRQVQALAELPST